MCCSSQVLCKNTYKCIPFWWRCDGQDDCGDGKDEANDTCDGRPPYFCRQGGLFQCANASSEQDCLNPARICDGVSRFVCVRCLVDG